MLHTGRPLHAAFALLIILAVTTAVYWPGLSGGFLFDDTINITDNPKVLIESLQWPELQRAAGAFGAGGLGRSLSMLSLGVNHALTGLDPFYFKLTNLIIHLLNGIGLWLLTRLLLGAIQIRHDPTLTHQQIAWLSIAVTAAWLLHPFNLSSVLYIVQRMASLAALFMIVGLVLYAWGRLRQLRGQRGAALMVGGVVVFGVLATLSKENGLLLPVLIFLIEWLIFGFQTSEPASRRFLVVFHAVIAIIPAVLALIVLLARFDWVTAGYEGRDFTLHERLLTQARVFWFYIQMILLPNPTRMGLYHDDIVLSSGWLHPITTLPAILGLVAVLVASIALRRRTPLLSFGILFFFAGHVLESTLLPLEIAHEHRNYLPSYGLLLVAIYYLGHRRLREYLSIRIQIALVMTLIVALSAGTAVRSSYWGNNLDLALVEVNHHPNSARTNMQAGYIFFYLAERQIEPEENLQRARHYFQRAWQLDRYSLASGFALLVLDDKEKHPVNPTLVDELADQLQHRPLSPASINAMLRLSQCQNDGPCRFPAEMLNRLFQAILQNPTLRHRPRAQVMTELAQFAISQNEMAMAVYITSQALELDPKNPQIHLNFAHLLIHVGELAAARQALDQAKTLDRDGFFADRMTEQEKLLEQAKAHSAASATDTMDLLPVPAEP